MIIQQLSLFETVDEIRTVQDFVDAAYELHKYAIKEGWTDEDFLTHVMRDFKSYHGGTCPEEFTGYTFYDFSPSGVCLQNFDTGKEIKFKKNEIIKTIIVSGYK